MAILERSVAICGKMLETRLYRGWPLKKQGWGGMQGNTDQCCSQHLQTAPWKKATWVVLMILWEIWGAEEMQYKKLNRICFKYNKESNDSKKSREWAGSGIWVWGIEFSEQDGGFLSGSLGDDSFFTYHLLCLWKRSCPFHFCSISQGESNREHPGWEDKKQELVQGEKMMLINTRSFFYFALQTIWPHPFATFLFSHHLYLGVFCSQFSLWSVKS